MGIVQLVEHWFVAPQVKGSSPFTHRKKFILKNNRIQNMPQLDIYTFIHQIGNFIPSMIVSYIILVIWILPSIYRVMAYRRLIIKEIIDEVNKFVEEREQMVEEKNKLVNYKKIYEIKVQKNYKALGEWCASIKSIEDLK